MASARLPLSRLAGIVAWTAASVTWGTAAVSLANLEPAQITPVALAAPPDPPPAEIQPEVVAPLPTMPESGLLILRYTPAERPEPEVVVRRVVVTGPSGGSAPAATSAPAPAPAPARETSSGS